MFWGRKNKQTNKTESHEVHICLTERVEVGSTNVMKPNESCIYIETVPLVGS